MDLEIAHLLPHGVQAGDSLPGGTADRAHGHDDPLGVGGAVVVEQVVILTGDGVDLLHIVLHDGGQLVVEAVVGLPELEVDVGILDGVAQGGVVGVQGGFPEAAHRLPVQHLAELLIGDGPDLLDLVGGAETVEEVEERHPAFDGGQMGHTGQVHDLLHAAGGEHGKAGLAAVHHVGVISEDGHGVGAHGAGSHVDNGGLAGTTDAVHDGDHEHQALGGRKGRGQGARLQGPVDRADGTGL